jgi:hypothetical protein
MARGAWVRAMTPAIVAAGGEMEVDPFGLFGETNGRVAYDPRVLEAIQNGGKAV